MIIVFDPENQRRGMVSYHIFLPDPWWHGYRRMDPKLIKFWGSKLEKCHVWRRIIYGEFHPLNKDLESSKAAEDGLRPFRIGSRENQRGDVCICACVEVGAWDMNQHDVNTKIWQNYNARVLWIERDVGRVMIRWYFNAKIGEALSRLVVVDKVDHLEWAWTEDRGLQ